MRSHPSESGGAWAEGGEGEMLSRPGGVRWGSGAGKGGTEGLRSATEAGEVYPWEDGGKERPKGWGAPPSAAFLKEVLSGRPGPSHFAATTRREEFGVGWLLKVPTLGTVFQSPELCGPRILWLTIRTGESL